MKKRNLQRIFAAFMASALALSTAACSKKADEQKPADDNKPVDQTQTTTPDASTTTPDTTTDVNTPDDQVDEIEVIMKDGKPVDLGGMEIIIRNWWSPEEPEAPQNEFQEAQAEWRDYIQETYHFKIRELAISDWGSAPQDFVDYATTGGDENYVFVLREDPAIVSAMSSGLMYDLATLDCLDFTDDMFMRNQLHKQYGKGASVYGMAAGFSEARTGVYFNKQVLRDAGIDPETIYDAQANGTWDWQMFDDMCAACQRDLDGDGMDDIFGITVNEGNMTNAAIFSNGGSYIDMDASGNFVYNLEAPETLEALEWTVDMYAKYDNHDPQDAAWDYYKEEFLSGKVAFMPDDAYAAAGNNFLDDVEFEVGFVMFPKGRSSKASYVNIWSNNIVAIPSCYSAEKAWNLAFAWKLYSTMPAGYENFIDLSTYRNAGLVDERAISETIVMMMQPEHGTVKYEGLVPNLNLGPDFTWGVGWYTNVSTQVESIRDTWQSYVNDANAK